VIYRCNHNTQLPASITSMHKLNQS